MAMLETPSRIWRRIEAVEGKDMPSLPSVPIYEDSVEASSDGVEDNDSEQLNLISSPIHSTPAATSSHHTMASTIRPSSTSSTARFAHSIASRSTKSAMSVSRALSTRQSEAESFDVSVIPSLPNMHEDEEGRFSEEMEMDESGESVPDGYLPAGEVDRDVASLTDALQPVSRNSSPLPQEELENVPTPKTKIYDYSVSLRSEPKPSPYDKFRNVSFRKPIPRARTPSLSRTTSSPVSSPTNSTPSSSKSIDLPFPSTTPSFPHASRSRSVSGSPAITLQGPNDDGPLEEFVPGVAQEPSQDGYREQDEYTADRANLETDIEVEPSEDHDEPGHRTNNEREGTSNEHEPTFSSEEAPTPYGQGMLDLNKRKSPMPLLSTFSSPAPSPSFTPTPAFPPRPRARFDIHPFQTPAGTPSQQPAEPRDENPVTPHTRRRSFLLSVINSTSRPRLKLPTPHPRRIDFDAETSPDDTQSTPCTNLRTAFAGATPRPKAKPRLSHPLAQTFIPSPNDSESDSGTRDALPQWTTPSSDGERASFISTASSHDLTAHQRANTSFDPVMGLGAQGHGVGRFNAGKLNVYLHGLNRRLQEENEGLVDRMRRMEEDVATNSGGRLSSIGDGSRRISVTGGPLCDVEEDVSGEGWVEEKAELENLVEEFKTEVQRCIAEKEDVESALDEERRERARDKERWRERMAEVEKGVGEIVKDLEQKLREAEKRATDVEKNGEEVAKGLQKKMAEIEEGQCVAIDRAKKAEQALESGRELGGELREANERIGEMMGDLRNANSQIRELQDDVLRSDGRIDELERDLRDEKEFAERLEDELKAKLDELASVHEHFKSLETDFMKAKDDMQITQTYTAELEEAIANLEKKLASANTKIEQMSASEEQANERTEILQSEARRNVDLARQMEEALDAAEKKMLADEEKVAELQSKLTSLQRERERESSSQPREPSQARNLTDAEVEALEDELDDANKEIARLNTLLNQSPARKAMEKAKETKIEMLEMEKEELLERVKALRTAMTEATTPSKIINASGISPIHRHVLSMSIRAPKTPGGPLRDMSWLNNTSSDPTVAPLVAEVSRLQRELDRANESIDDKLDRLEDAGLGVVGLTKKLEDARCRIVGLEDEIARLSRRELRRLHRLERVRCQKCHVRLDLRGMNRAAEGDESSLEVSHTATQSEPPTPPTRTSEALRENLRLVNTQLDGLKNKWVTEKGRLLDEKAALQDAANRLNAQVHDVKEEIKRVSEANRDGEKKRIGALEELNKARGIIAHLEADLKSERARLRGLTVEQDRVKRQKDEVLVCLQRTESDMEDVKEQLRRCKQENHGLERELRANATADQKARLLEARVAENLETIEQLRQERSLLTTDHKELQRRFSEISEQVNHLRDEYAACQTSHDNRRHQLDLHLGEIDDLHRALSDQADELQRTEAEKKRIATKQGDVARTVEALEADLKRVRKTADEFSRDLKLLRAEKEKSAAKQKEELAKAERARRQSQAQLRLLTDQLESQRQKITQAKEELKNHVCVMDERQLSAMKLQHNKECKGLIEQIRYLKFKFTRESSFRLALGYQKAYLVILLSMYQKNEETVIAAIARIGFPTPTPVPPKKTRTLKSIALSVVFTLRARRASDLWKEQCSSKEAIAAALQEVRRRRVAGS